MSKGTVLTVSVAAYNVERYLGEALRSCVGLDDGRVEVIVVDDGSSDATLEIAREFERGYSGVVRVVSKENGGYGSTVNTSLGLATGTYFRYLDGDDWFLWDGLGEHLDALEANVADCVCAPYVCVNREAGYERVVDPAAGRTGILQVDALTDDMRLSGHSLTYRTGLLRRIGFRMTEHRFYTDNEYAYIPMSHASTLLVTHSPLYAYRVGHAGQSVSIEGIERHCEDMLEECLYLLGCLTRDGEVRTDNGADAYIGGCLAREVVETTLYLCGVAPSATRRRELAGFCRLMPEFPGILADAMRMSKITTIVNRSHLWFYPLAHVLARRRLFQGR